MHLKYGFCTVSIAIFLSGCQGGGTPADITEAAEAISQLLSDTEATTFGAEQIPPIPRRPG